MTYVSNRMDLKNKNVRNMLELIRWASLLVVIATFVWMIFTAIRLFS